MARKDNIGRNLKTGEYQRRMDVMSIATRMKLPESVIRFMQLIWRACEEMEKEDQDMDDLLITDASVKKLTINTLFERYMATKNIKERTKKNYIRMWDYRIRNILGNIRVVDFKTSHVRTFFSALSDEGLAHRSKQRIALNPSFELAVEDRIIRRIGTLFDLRLRQRKRSTDTGTAGKTEVCGTE